MATATRIVIVGASLTGATAAATLRKEGFDGDVVLIGAEPHLPYERPPLSKSFLRGETPFEDALARPESFYSENRIELLAGTTAAALDTDARRVIAAGHGEVAYDRLLLATGARNRSPSIPGLDLDGVCQLRSLEDCQRIREEAAPGRQVVVVGMGFIGSEVAASLRALGLDVTAVDSSSFPLQRILGEQVGRSIGALHADNGVRLVPGDGAAAFEGTGKVEAVTTRNGLRLGCDFVVAGVGVEPVTDLAAGTAIEVDNGILVDRFCRTNVEGVFAAGDVANHDHPVFGRRIRVEHWHNAVNQGKAAALNILGKETVYDSVHWFWSDQYDANLQYAGFHTEWDDLVVRGSIEGRNFSAFYVKQGRVQAAVAMNRGRDVRQAIPLIKAGGRIDRDRLADQDVPVRSNPAGPAG